MLPFQSRIRATPLLSRSLKFALWPILLQSVSCASTGTRALHFHHQSKVDESMKGCRSCQAGAVVIWIVLIYNRVWHLL